MTMIKNQFEIESVEEFLNEHENKTADEMLEFLAEQLLAKGSKLVFKDSRKKELNIDEHAPKVAERMHAIVNKRG